MPDASPTKWHLAHTTWFFETFVLARAAARLPRRSTRATAYLFNSYYDAVGARHPRPRARPAHRGRALEEVRALPRARRRAPWSSCLDRTGPGARRQPGVDVRRTPRPAPRAAAPGAASSPTSSTRSRATRSRPAYRDRIAPRARRLDAAGACTGPRRLVARFAEGLRSIGHERRTGFAFDNERPRHRVFLEPFALAARLGHQRRVPRLHRRRRLPRPDSGSPTAGRRARARWTAPLYWEAAGAGDGAPVAVHACTAAPLDPPRPSATSATTRPTLRALGRSAPADRGRVGGRGRGGAPHGNFVESGHARAHRAGTPERE